MNELTRTTITSMEAAEWCGKRHTDLLRDIRKYVQQLGESKKPKLALPISLRNLHTLPIRTKRFRVFLLRRRGVNLSPTR